MVVLFQPCAAYLTFKFDKWILTRFKRKPVRSYDASKLKIFITSFNICRSRPGAFARP